jgi:hypothetical protein
LSLLTQLVAAGAIPMDDLHVKLLVHGRSGSGKSTLGAKMPKPLIILLEPNGLPSILAANPAALVIRAYDPNFYDDKKTGKKTTYDVLREALAIASTGGFDGVESIVLDSATEAQRVIKEQMIREKDPNININEYVMTIPDWGVLTERMRRFCRLFRDLPYNTLMITLSNEEKNEDGKIVAVMPSFEGKKMPEEVAQFQSAVGYAFRRTIKIEGQPDGTAFEVVFQTGAGHTVKPVAPLRAIEVADPSDWIRRVRAHKPGDAMLPPLNAPKPVEAKAPDVAAKDEKPADKVDKPADPAATVTEPVAPKPEGGAVAKARRKLDGATA